MLTLCILLGVAAVMFVYGGRTLRQNRQLMAAGEKVEARVAGDGTSTKGPYYVLEFRTAGGVHRLQYPYVARRSFCRVGDTVTLYYDPYHPEKLLVQQDKAAFEAVWFSLGCGAVLVAMAVVLMF